MKWSKKLVLVVALGAVVLLGSIGGIALAQTGSDDGSQSSTDAQSLLEKVCQIYQDKTGVAIDQAALQDSFAQARQEMRSEALDNYLNGLVADGKITQEQAEQYKDWQQARPDMPLLGRFGGHGFFRGMGGMRGFGGPCIPSQ